MIVMAHGVGGVRTMRLDAFAERFAAQGFACLVFDYRHFGESGGEPRQLLDIDHQQEDWHSALAHARTLSNIDPSRIALWGTSFGGGHVLAVAAQAQARGQTVAAVVAQCPFTHGLASSLTLSPLTSLKVSALAMSDRVGSWFGCAPRMVAVAAKPGETGLMNAPDAYDGYTVLRKAGCTAPNEVAARFALDIIGYYPGRSAKKISAPVLFCVCETDSVAPAGPTLRYAAQAARGEIKTYRDGHFDIYVGDAFERVVADQIEFLNRHLKALPSMPASPG